MPRSVATGMGNPFHVRAPGKLSWCSRFCSLLTRPAAPGDQAYARTCEHHSGNPFVYEALSIRMARAMQINRMAIV